MFQKYWPILIIVLVFSLIFFYQKRNSNRLTLPITNQRIIETTPATKENTSIYNFKEYRNDTLGVSFKYPEQTFTYHGKCKQDSNGYYVTELDLLPITVLEDNNTLYITNPYYFEATNEKTVGQYIYNTKCEKVETTIALLRENQVTGHVIKVASVQDDKDISKFITNIAGDGCVLGEKKQKDDGQFEIIIKNIGSRRFTGCQINGPLTYSPMRQKIFYFRYGQDCVFFQGQKGKEVCLSEILRDSIKLY